MFDGSDFESPDVARCVPVLEGHECFEAFRGGLLRMRHTRRVVRLHSRSRDHTVPNR